MQSVMIIEDEDDAGIARLLARHLDHHSRRSRVLSSGEENSSIPGNHGATLPDAVMCDLGLPGSSGVEVVEAGTSRPTRWCSTMYPPAPPPLASPPASCCIPGGPPPNAATMIDDDEVRPPSAMTNAMATAAAPRS